MAITLTVQKTKRQVYLNHVVAFVAVVDVSNSYYYYYAVYVIEPTAMMAAAAAAVSWT